MRNLFEFLELEVRDQNTGEEWSGPINSIEFKDVSFRYPLVDTDVLRSVSFRVERGQALALVGANGAGKTTIVDRKSTRLNSSHVAISYAVFCLKKKKQQHA